jgi:dienelactone hydrolase
MHPTTDSLPPPLRRRIGAARALAICLLVAAVSACSREELTAEQACNVGIYRLADGRLLDIAPSEGKDLRWRLEDGRTGRLRADRSGLSTQGWTDIPDGIAVTLPGCGAPERRVQFSDHDGAKVSGPAVPLLVTETKFRSTDVSLSGRLVLPPGSGAVPIVVAVHGSEKDSAILFNFYQRLLPAQGIGVFVYDKRGTGGSEGRYTQDFNVLADDAVAAVAEARRLADSRVSRVGFQGTSQGGWIAPLAATKTTVDFVIVDFGLAGSVAEENRDQVAVELTRLGYQGQDLTEAAQVADAASEVLGSHFRSGFKDLDDARARYGKRPWFAKLNGQFTGELLKYPDWVLRIGGRWVDVHTPIYYDAMAVLRKVRTPMLWVLAGDDTYAPNATTQARLKELTAAGLSIDALLFPGTEHGIEDIKVAPDGSREELGYADGYFRTTVDFARVGRLSGPYGRSISLIASSSSAAGDGARR